MKRREFLAGILGSVGVAIASQALRGLVWAALMPLVGRVIREFILLARLEHRREQQFSELTPREREVLELLAEGLRNQDIAGRLSIPEKTLEHHISSILFKLSCKRTVA